MNAPRSKSPARLALAGVFGCLAGAVLFSGCRSGVPKPMSAVSPPSPRAGECRITFSNVTRAAKLDFRQTTGATGRHFFLETTGSGACWFDYDGDGWMDLYVVQNGPLAGAPAFGSGGNRLYHNRRDGTFEDVTSQAGVPGRGYGQGCCAADFDNDGHEDLFVTGYGANVLYRNNGNGTFTDVTSRSGLALAGGWSTSAAFADYDHDGRVDLFVGHYCAYRVGQDPVCPLGPGVVSYCRPDHFPGESGHLYHNEGNGKFQDVTRAAGVFNADGKNLAVVWGDVDGDGYPDLFVANDNRRNLLYRNEPAADGSRHFAEVGLQAGVALSEDGRTMAGMGVDLADYDNDGRLDLVATDYADAPNELWHNEGNWIFSDATYSSGVGPPSVPLLGFGVAFLDADLDGFKDLVVANGHVMDNIARVRRGVSFAQPALFYHNRGNGTFAELSNSLGSDFTQKRIGRGLAVADYDNDGDPDLLQVSLNGPVALLRNDGGSRGHWLSVRCEGTRSGRDALGARVTVWQGKYQQCAEVRSGSSYLSQNDPRLLFGLGSAARVDRVEVKWPAGARSELRDVAGNQQLTVREPAGGNSK